MNKFKASVLSASALLVIAAAGNAFAAGGHGGHGGGWHGGGHGWHGGHVHSGVRIGVGFGVPWYGYGGYWPYPYYGAYYPPYPYAYPVAAEPAGPAAYVEQGQQPAPAASAGAYWYYCNESQAYYPYVNQCAGPWQRVAPQPPPQS